MDYTLVNAPGYHTFVRFDWTDQGVTHQPTSHAYPLSALYGREPPTECTVAQRDLRVSEGLRRRYTP